MFKKGLLTLLIYCCFFSNATSQITCDFSYTDVTGCGAFAVNFCDLSSSTAGDIVAWTWDMEVSSFSVECPSTVFNQSGFYTVCLTVTDSGGNTCTVCKDDLVQVYQLPIPDFEGIPNSGCTPVDVTYTDLSESPDGNIVDWLWGLGGSCGTIQGNGSTPAAICTYSIPDSYNISLTISDDNGCVNTINKVGYVNVSPTPDIIVSAVDTFDCTGPFSVSFLNNSDITNINYVWDFGNSQSYEGAFPPDVLYTDPGSYTVTIIATDTLSFCQDTLVLDNYINIGYPASFTYTPENGCEDLLVSFSDQSLFAADNVEWNFGDGGTSTEANPSYLFTIPGCFTVQLTRYVGGCTSVVYSDVCINVDAEPDVSYTNDNLIGCVVPHVVNFSGLSNTATEWLWDFGDGNSSTEQNPTHTYSSFGNFPVTLTVTNAAGCTNDVQINTINNIELEGELVNGFYNGCIPLLVTLEENSISVTGITSWNWEATNGTNVYTSTDPSPTFTILDTGVYNVTLIVTNTLGCIDTAYFPYVIEAGDYPDVNFEADALEVCIETEINFTDLTPGDVDEWYWDFGDGGFSDLQNPEYSYSDTGYYDVSLIVINNGCISTITFDEYIHVMAPVAKFEVINFCDDNLNRKFVNTSIGADSVYWDFGVIFSASDTSTLTNPEFTFPSTGTFVVTQWVYNSETMCSHSTTFEVIITNPIADFYITPNQGCTPLTLSITDESNDAVSWQWSSANGTISNNTLQNPVITYSQPGLFTDDISLIITDLNECQDTITLTDSIWVNAVIANFTSDIVAGCAPLTVSFSDLSVNDYFAEVVSWEWFFGAGLGSTTEQNPVFTFDTPGLYNVVLQVTDSWGCTDFITLVDYIDVTFPEAAFTVDTLSCTQNDLQFQTTSSGWQLDYSWDFGDGSTSVLPNPVHAYLSEGVFTACLSIVDGYDCSSVFCQDIVVADPVAAFSLDSTFASCPPLPVNFTNMSVNATSYLWNFGDGNAPSDFVDPTYVYTAPGVFDVELIAISTPSCQDTLLYTDLIVLDGPVGEYTVSIDSACAPAEITFVANSVDYYIYIWDFGEGLIDSSATPIIYDSVTYIYDEIGTFTPTLSLLNNTGCFRTLPVVTDIYISGLETDITASQTIICGDDPVGITFTPTFTSTDSILGVAWIFENGNPPNSTSIEPTIVYSLAGYHDVTLITNAGLCVDTFLQEDFIKVGAVPIANFSMTIDEGCDPLSIGFLDNSFVSDGNIVAWNWDFGDGTTSNEQNPTHVFGPGANIAINLEVTTDIGCTNSFFDNIVVHALAEIDAGADVEVCIGEATQLQGIINGDTSQFSYSWSPANGLSCVNCLDPWVTDPIDTITYTFIVTSAEGCTSTDEVTVLVKPFEAPTLTLSPDTAICLNDLTQITVGVENDILIYSYQWDSSTPGLSCYDDCFNPVATPEVTSTYVVTVTTDQGCYSIDSVLIEVENMFQPFTGEDKIICAGDSIELDASFGQNPIWTTNNTLSCAFCPNPTAFPDSTTTYIVHVETDMGCEIMDTIIVNVLYKNEVGAGVDFAVCLGEVAYLEGYGPGEISWSPDATLNDPTIINPEALPSENTSYVMTAVNGNCTYSDTVLVSVIEKTELEGTEEIICQGDEIQLSVAGFADQYQWSPEEAFSNSTIAQPLTDPDVSTEYTVIGTLGLCEPDTASVYVEVIPAPQFNMDKVRYFLPGQTIQLNVELQESGNFTYQWSPAMDLSCSECDSPTLRPEINKVYTLTVTNEDTGCSFSRSVSVEKLTNCSEDLVGVPNVFSPNDDGVNDELQMIVSPTVPEVRLFNIYDRWGALVFSSTNRYGSWDGTLKGQKRQEGVYVYMVRFICGLDGSLITKKGDITIMR